MYLPLSSTECILQHSMWIELVGLFWFSASRVRCLLHARLKLDLWQRKTWLQWFEFKLIWRLLWKGNGLTFNKAKMQDRFFNKVSSPRTLVVFGSICCHLRLPRRIQSDPSKEHEGRKHDGGIPLRFSLRSKSDQDKTTVCVLTFYIHIMTSSSLSN